MTTISQRELRNDSGQYLRRAAAGETFVITSNGKVMAVLSPPVGSNEERITRMIASGAITSPAPRRRMSGYRGPVVDTQAALDELRDDRL